MQNVILKMFLIIFRTKRRPTKLPNSKLLSLTNQQAAESVNKLQINEENKKRLLAILSGLILIQQKADLNLVS